MTIILKAHWVGNVALTKFAATALHHDREPVAPVYGVDTPQRWPLPPQARRWFPRLPVRTDTERAAVSAATRARVERILAERRAERKAAIPWPRAVDGVLQTRNIQAPG